MPGRRTKEGNFRRIVDQYQLIWKLNSFVKANWSMTIYKYLEPIQKYFFQSFD